MTGAEEPLAEGELAALLNGVAPVGSVSAGVVLAALAYGRRLGWSGAPPSLLTELPAHAAHAGLIDDLLTDEEYLLHADLPRLLGAADRAVTPAGRSRARLLRLTPRAAGASPAERTALLSLTECLEHLGTGFAVEYPALYRARWTSVVAGGDEYAVLEGDPGGAHTVVCAVPAAGRVLLAASAGEEVRLCDPETLQPRRVLPVQRVRALCAVPVAGRVLLAVAEYDSVRLWDPETGEPQGTLPVSGWMKAMCAVPVPGGSLLAVVTSGNVQLLDPGTGEPRWIPPSEAAPTAACVVPVAGRDLLAVGYQDDRVRLWDPGTGELAGTLSSHEGGPDAMCAVPVAGRVLLATAGDTVTGQTADGRPEWDDTRVWLTDPENDASTRILSGHTQQVRGVCALPAAGRTLLASAGSGEVLLWDPGSGEPPRTLTGRASFVDAVCAVPVAGRTLLVTAGDDLVQLWDPESEERQHVPRSCPRSVVAMCAMPVADRTLLATATSYDITVRLVDAETGQPGLALKAASNFVTYKSVEAVCAVPVAGRILLAAATSNGKVTLWDFETGRPWKTVWHRQVSAICVVPVAGRTLLATASRDKVRLWNPETARQERTLNGGAEIMCLLPVPGGGGLLATAVGNQIDLWDAETGQPRRTLNTADRVDALCAVPADQGTLLAAASSRTVSLYDPGTGQRRHELTGHTAPVNAMCLASIEGQVLLATAGDDRTVRLWDPATATPVVVIPVYLRATACIRVGETLVVGLSAGLIAIHTEP